MSFINLMASDEWSEEDILSRTEAMIASEFSAQAASILHRKVSACMLGMHKFTNEEQAELERYAKVSSEAQQAGQQARADMALLREVLAIERGTIDLSAATEAAQALHALRHPTPIEPIEPTEPVPLATVEAP